MRELIDDATPPVPLIPHSPQWLWGTLGALYAFSFSNPLANAMIRNGSAWPQAT
ncbi:hypothetical protein GCM10009655_02480 [Rhodoglobus aureus]|uniref:Uncharacterized protein n=1 Tax=Rhodoglobus aureus TaxID=191497 RepID=A0ABN1VH19_9MICO